jgi:hypothetical protein
MLELRGAVVLPKQSEVELSFTESIKELEALENN